MSYRGKQGNVTGCTAGIGLHSSSPWWTRAYVNGYDITPKPDLGPASFATLDARGVADAARSGRCAFQLHRRLAIHRTDAARCDRSEFRRRPRVHRPRGGANGDGRRHRVGRLFGGWGWPRNPAALPALVATPDFDAARAWIDADPALIDKGYLGSKEAVVVWTMITAPHTIQRCIRLNCICPGPVDTPMLKGIVAETGERKVDAYAWPIGRRSRAGEQAEALLFLNSERASYINGVALDVDGGLHGAALSGEVDQPAMLGSSAEDPA
jgi:NAD(P)-dependent dehydrogenase (short-subunit alcohol dehydrogenase family)